MSSLIRMAILIVAMAVLPMSALGQHHGHGDNPAPYAGSETREIKSLPEQDVEEIRRVGGWGLALPAELSGRPGPATFSN